MVMDQIEHRGGKQKTKLELQNEGQDRNDQEDISRFSVVRDLSPKVERGNDDEIVMMVKLRRNALSDSLQAYVDFPFTEKRGESGPFKMGVTLDQLLNYYYQLKTDFDSSSSDSDDNGDEKDKDEESSSSDDDDSGHDGDGLPDTVDPDSGGDPLPNPDGDGDGVSDGRDGDSDGDGVPDQREASDEAAATPIPGNDTDGDGINDRYDPDQGATPYTNRDTDSDGQPDQRDTDADGDGVSDQREAFDVNDDGVIDSVPSGTDNDGDGIDDGLEKATTINSDYRQEAWRESCRAQNLGKKLRRVRNGTTALWQRVALFAGKSKRCKGPGLEAEIVAAKQSYDTIMERLALEYGGDTYRCSQNACATEKTSLGRNRVNRLVDDLYRQAKAAKKQAIVSCKTPPRDPALRDPRWNTEDYRREVRSAVKDLPTALTRCP
jgi:hypothetical protein